MPKLARSPSPDLENQLIALNSTQQIKHSHNKINNAVQNFRAILAASKNYTETKMMYPEVNMSVEHLKSPFKKEMNSLLGDDLLSPFPHDPEGTSTFTKSECRHHPIETECYDRPLLSPIQRCKDFNQKTLSLATGLRYVKTADLLFLLEDYAPDKNISH